MSDRSPEVMAFYGQMVHAFAHLNDVELAALNEWERTHLGESKQNGTPYGSSDWPGWADWNLPRPSWWDR